MESSNQQLSYLGKYKILQTLGQGNYAKVKLAIDSETQNRVAIKIMKQEANLNSVTKEVSIMQQLSHPNIVNLLDCNQGEYINSRGKVKTVIYLVMEYAEGGDVKMYLSYTVEFSRDVSRSFFNQLLNALEYCISRNISHRDLKPENLLYDQNFNLKVADFGFATFLSGKDGSGKLNTGLGTYAYMAPEIFQDQPSYSGEAVDLYASAIILFNIYAGCLPFPIAKSQNPNYRLFINDNQKFWYKYSEFKQDPNFFEPEFKDLISRMLAYDPKNRMSLQQAIQFFLFQVKEHPWVKGQQANQQEIKVEFQQRLQAVKQAQEAERQQNLLQQQQSNMMFTAQQGFRSIGQENNEYEYNLSEFYEDLALPRTLEEKQFKVTKLYDFVTMLDADCLLRSILGICSEKVNIYNNQIIKDFSRVKLNQHGKYKIYCEIEFDELLQIDILIQKLNEDSNCVSYIKKSGSYEDFLEIVKALNKQLQKI